MNIIRYILWHYGYAVKNIFVILYDLVRAIFSLFSVRLFIRTFFSPIFSVREDVTAQSDIGASISVFVANIVMRLIGVCLRFLFISIALCGSFAVLVLGVILFVYWILVPVALAVVIYYISVDYKIAVPVLMILLAIHSILYRNYFLFRGISRVYKKVDDLERTFEANRVLSSKNFVKSLLGENISHFILMRLGLSLEEIKDNIVPLANNYDFTYILERENVKNKYITIGEIWYAIFKTDERFRKFLLAHKIQEQILFNTCEWADRLNEIDKKSKAFWWRENLSREKGLFKNLSYGTLFYISKYANEILSDKNLYELGESLIHKEKVFELEKVLVRESNANAVIVGAEDSGRYTIALALSKMIYEGSAYHEIEDKRVFVLNELAISRVSDKQELENIIVNVFNEASIGGNIIFLIKNVVSLCESCKRLGVDFFELTSQYLGSSSVTIIAIIDEISYNQPYYKNIFNQGFEAVNIPPVNTDAIIPFIQDEVIMTEMHSSHIFSSSAIDMLAKDLSRYFVEDSPLTKTRLLLGSLIDFAGQNNYVDSSTVSLYMEKIVGVSSGMINEKEKNKLLGLEDEMRKYVMGQDEAIEQVGKIMRRVKSGLSDVGRPMASFLFLGPTGTGKTETALSLAEIFFNSSDNMSRLDMGEYTSPESSYRLLGNESTVGELEKMIHLRPHGVLLLDEFEKSTREVKDIFLRILDEGLYTTGQGKKISLRTQIIIATSNAGADYLRSVNFAEIKDMNQYEIVKAGLLDNIQNAGLFRPELLNRFDAIAMYRPIGDNAMLLIINKNLQKFRSQLMEKGYDVEFDNEIAQVLTGLVDVTFAGGRGADRVVKEKVEDIVSKMIISGQIQIGQKYSVMKEDVVV